MTTTRSVRVELGERSYAVNVAPGALDHIGIVVRDCCPRSSGRVMLVADTGVPPAVQDALHGSLTAAGYAVTFSELTPTERTKSLKTLESLLREMSLARLERGDPVIALGGGIVGDVAGFAAATYRRGVPVVQCPTTLLAMVDASVGGKTAINLSLNPTAPDSLRKNLVGAFHQPVAVVADTTVLASLPDRVFRSGLAECLKHGMIGADAGDAALFEWTTDSIPALLTRDAHLLAELVERNVRVKAAVVAGDEHELAPSSIGGRALLNLGHTFAHALEVVPTLSPDADPAHAPLQHGEAVAAGLVCAAHLGVSLALLDPPGLEEVNLALATIGLPTRLANLPRNEEILKSMHDDKKVQGGRLRLVVPRSGRRACVLDDVPRTLILAAIDALRE